MNPVICPSVPRPCGLPSIVQRVGGICACLKGSAVTCKWTATPAKMRCANRKVSPGAGCFDHVRRKFTDAKKGEAKPGNKVQNAKVSKADVALGKIRKLYAI